MISDRRAERPVERRRVARGGRHPADRTVRLTAGARGLSPAVSRDETPSSRRGGGAG